MSNTQLRDLRLLMDQNKMLCEKDSNCSHFESKSFDNKKPIFWEKAKKDLIKRDKKLASIIKNYPNDFLFLTDSASSGSLVVTIPPSMVVICLIG